MSTIAEDLEWAQAQDIAAKAEYRLRQVAMRQVPLNAPDFEMVEAIARFQESVNRLSEARQAFIQSAREELQ